MTRRSPFYLSSRSLNNISGVDYRLIELSQEAIRITKIDFGHGPHSGLRSAEEQRNLYASGKSKADGYKYKSPHQSGKAIDFYAYVDGQASWDPAHLAMVATAFLQAACNLGYRIEWGGLWHSFEDRPHIQLVED